MISFLAITYVSLPLSCVTSTPCRSAFVRQRIYTSHYVAQTNAIKVIILTTM